MVIINNCGNNITGAITLITIIIVSKHSAYEGKDNRLWMMSVTDSADNSNNSEQTHTYTHARTHTRTSACMRTGSESA